MQSIANGRAGLGGTCGLLIILFVVPSPVTAPACMLLPLYYRIKFTAASPSTALGLFIPPAADGAGASMSSVLRRSAPAASSVSTPISSYTSADGRSMFSEIVDLSSSGQ